MSPKAVISEKSDHPSSQLCFWNIAANDTITIMSLPPLEKAGVEGVKGYF